MITDFIYDYFHFYFAQITSMVVSGSKLDDVSAFKNFFFDIFHTSLNIRENPTKTVKTYGKSGFDKINYVFFIL